MDTSSAAAAADTTTATATADVAVAAATLRAIVFKASLDMSITAKAIALMMAVDHGSFGIARVGCEQRLSIHTASTLGNDSERSFSRICSISCTVSTEICSP